VNSLPKTVTRQRRSCDLNQGLSAPESSTLNTSLPSHPSVIVVKINNPCYRQYDHQKTDLCNAAHEAKISHVTNKV